MLSAFSLFLVLNLRIKIKRNKGGVVKVGNGSGRSNYMFALGPFASGLFGLKGGPFAIFFGFCSIFIKEDI